MQAYTNEADIQDPHKLPDLWVEHWANGAWVEWTNERGGYGEPFCVEDPSDAFDAISDWKSVEITHAPGYYVCVCFPGCLPESDWHGPYQTPDEAIEEMRNQFGGES